ncbi:hypothetical protein HGRIS_008525 [Hohenbuehelia grisea]|uniref:Uncharacterized protein n=1 Tax=Hohenbuehelia grisea TaxID=104357 RepID=A0ABR3J9Q0_9AGAR
MTPGGRKPRKTVSPRKEDKAAKSPSIVVDSEDDVVLVNKPDATVLRTEDAAVVNVDLDIVDNNFKQDLLDLTDFSDLEEESLRQDDVFDTMDKVMEKHSKAVSHAQDSKIRSARSALVAPKSVPVVPKAKVVASPKVVSSKAEAERAATINGDKPIASSKMTAKVQASKPATKGLGVSKAKETDALKAKGVDAAKVKATPVQNAKPIPADKSKGKGKAKAVAEPSPSPAPAPTSDFDHIEWPRTPDPDRDNAFDSTNNALGGDSDAEYADLKVEKPEIDDAMSEESVEDVGRDRALGVPIWDLQRKNPEVVTAEEQQVHQKLCALATFRRKNSAIKSSSMDPLLVDKLRALFQDKKLMPFPNILVDCWPTLKVPECPIFDDYMRYSKLISSLPESIAKVVKRGVEFDKCHFFVNPSRCNPDVFSLPQGGSGTIKIADPRYPNTNAVCILIVAVDESKLINPATVGQTRQKKLSAFPLASEFVCAMSRFAQIAETSSFYGPLAGNRVTFTTQKEDSAYKVPIYDAGGAKDLSFFRFKADQFCCLKDYKLYGHGKRDLPSFSDTRDPVTDDHRVNFSVAAVGYTVQIWKRRIDSEDTTRRTMDGDGRPTITFSLQFVILFSHSSVVVPSGEIDETVTAVDELENDPWPLGE